MTVIFLSSSVAVYIIICGKDCKHWLWQCGHCNAMHQLSKLDIMNIRELLYVVFLANRGCMIVIIDLCNNAYSFFVKQHVAWYVSCMLSPNVDYHNTNKDG